jgi:hypothetical protein
MAYLKKDRRFKENKTGNKRTLTPKQSHFARCVAQGMSLADAYREAYDTNAKPQTIYTSATALNKDPMIRDRIDKIIAAKDLAVVRNAVHDREKVRAFLRDMMETAEPKDSAKLRAAELLGKSSGLFIDHVSSVEKGDSAEEVKQQIIQKLEEVVSKQNKPEKDNNTEVDLSITSDTWQEETAKPDTTKH